ncbi:MAG TPA: glycosyltransferase [Chlamydiales bacterium]|nr:glycosyltransferase [Chlamydiales bacterium]
MKTALVYDWFTEGAGGGEKAFEAMYELYPSPIYTLLYSPEAIRGTAFEKETIHPSLIQKFPKALKYYRSYLPFYPFAIEQFDLSSYDLILSCSHCVAKGILTHADQIHLNYCCTPVRYAWDLYHQYLNEANIKKGIKGRLAQFFLHYLRLWDFSSSGRVDGFSAISHHVAKRIRKTYGREARVIYPPVDTDFYQLKEKKENFYLAASRFVPYKKMDLIVEAFSQMPNKRLVVIGDGPDFQKVKAKAGKNIELLGYQPNEVLKTYLQNAKAFVFAAIEDFGILPLEAQACGTPVIAFGKGALLETIQADRTGLFFSQQTSQSIQEAISRFESSQDHFNPTLIRSHAESFGRKRFSKEFRLWVEEEIKRLNSRSHSCIF